jgi:2-polyprenyl-3-methyl-5-hydroxy-6-metoxy-1,4-benzoquinol methylase
MSLYQRVLRDRLFTTSGRRAKFLASCAVGMDVLDVGVVMHDAQAYLRPDWLHRHVAAVAKSCLGIDSDEVGIAALLEKGFNVRVADACDLELGDLTFDVIMAGDVLEHLDNLAGFCRGARKYLRPGGRLIIATPNPWWWVRFVQAAMGRVRVNPEHTIWLSPETAAELLDRFGFVVDHVVWGSDQAWLYRVPAPGLTRHTSFYLSAHAVRNVN